jgi:hypothetical protein
MSNRARVFKDHAIAAPGANTNIFTALAPNHPGSYWDIDISLATASIVDLRVTDGTTAYSQALWDEASLTAGRRYSCSVLVPKASVAGTALTYSLRVRTDGIIQSLCIDEVSDR